MNDNVKNNNKKNTKASAMIYSLVFLYITSLIAIGLINLFESQLKLASSKIRLEQRYELLNTGLDIAMSFLANNFSNSTPTIDNLKTFNNNYYNVKNYNLQVYIFDKKTIEKTLTDKTIKAIENEIRQNGVRNLENNLGSINGNNIAELPYLIVSKASASKGTNTYQIALVNLEYFSRYAYFTNFEKPPDGGVIWFGIGSDFFNGPVRTNDKFVFWTFKTSGISSFYDDNTLLKPTFKGKFIFTGTNKFLSNLNWQDNEIDSEKKVNSDGGIFLDLGILSNNPDTEEKLSQIIEGGSINLEANAKKIDLNSKLASEDNVKNQIWPNFSSNPPNLNEMGVFIKTDDSSNINSALLVNPENDNKIYSLNLEVNQGVQAYKIKFKKDEPAKEITIYKVDNNNFNIPANGITNPNFKVKVIDNLEPNKAINLLSYFEDENSFQEQGNSYSVNQKALVLTRAKNGIKEVVVINLNDKSFPKNVIWVNGSIGDKLDENNKEGGLSGVYNEPLTIIAKPAKTSDQVDPNDFYDIRINGNIVPYGLNIDPNFRIPELTKDDKRIMGLYADRIFIGSNAKNNLLRDTNGKEHIYIYSSIMAIKARDRNNIDGYFEVEDHGRSNVWGNFYSNRRYLHIYGGLTQCYRGGVIAFDLNTNFLAGFLKDYNYDKRLAYMNPPYFPTTGEYIILFKKILTNY
jgi:hypothetical protein